MVALILYYKIFLPGLLITTCFVVPSLDLFSYYYPLQENLQVKHTLPLKTHLNCYLMSAIMIECVRIHIGTFVKITSPHTHSIWTATLPW